MQPQVKNEEEDGWGDFEIASPQIAEFPTSNMTKPDSNGAGATLVSQNRPTRIIRASTIELMTNSLVDLGPEASKLDPVVESPSWIRKSTESVSKVKHSDPNVLFDADDFDERQLPSDEDEDDFGDFEGPTSGTVQASAPPLMDLLSSSGAPQPARTRKVSPSQLLSTLSIHDGHLYPQGPRSPSFQERNPFPGLGLKTPVAEGFPNQDQAKAASPVTAWPSSDTKTKTNNKADANITFEDDWGTFDNLPPQAAEPLKPSKTATMAPAAMKPSTSKAAPSNTVTVREPASDWDWGSWDAGKDTTQPPGASTRSATITTSGPPPSNIPPPSVLLSIFPSLLDTAHTSLFQPTASVPATVKDRVLGSPQTIDFLRGYLAVATVAARIIAGRKLRWHRDKFLAQSMTISAATGGKGGMKLAGIDKTQTAKDEQEAAVVVAAWKNIVGRLRTAVGAANVAISKEKGVALKVPELSESVKPSTLKGALTAPKACVVCGLKRDERLAKVDFDVEDSFGEYWIEFWGHRDCRNFWVEHEAALRSR
jgi:hypothetical protein